MSSMRAFNLSGGNDSHVYWTVCVVYPGFESLGPFKPCASHPDVVFVNDGTPFFNDLKTAKNAALAAAGDREISALLDEVVSN